MRIYQPSFGNRIGYFLWWGDVLHPINDPKGYQNDWEVRNRDPEMSGLIRKTSDNLKLYRGEDGGYDFLRSIKDRGIKEEVYLVKSFKNQGSVEEEYRSFLDLPNCVSKQDDNGTLYWDLKSKDTGIDPVIKSRKSEVVEMERKTTLDGEIIPDSIPYERVRIKDRRFELKSFQKANQELVEFTPSRMAIPTDIVYTGSDSFVTVTDTDWDDVSSIFFLDSPYDYSVDRFRVKLDYRLRLDRIQSQTTYTVWLTYFDENRDAVFSISMDTGTALIAGIIEGSIDLPVGISKNQSIGINIQFHDLDETTPKAMFPLKWEVKVENIDVFEDTYTIAYKVKDVINRLLYIYTGKDNLVKSDFLDTIGNLFYITDGGYLRNIPRNISDDTERAWSLSTSLEEILQAFDATWCLKGGIERSGRREYFRVEPTGLANNHFFRNSVSLDLGKLRRVSRRTASEYVYSSLKIGYDDGVTLEGVFGLDKVHGLVSRSTCITEQQKSYEKISPYQMDDYLIKKARQKQYIFDPTEDTELDDVKFFLDCKYEGGELVQRSVLDDLTEVPTGVFDAENLKGARWTPLACLLRHGGWIRSGLTDYLTSVLSYTSSNAKVQLSYKLKKHDGYDYLNEEEYRESDDIFVAQLPKEVFYTEEIEAEAILTYDQIKLTDNNGFYNRVKFLNEFNEEETGFLTEVAPKGKEKVKILKYRKKPIEGIGDFNNDYGLDYD